MGNFFWALHAHTLYSWRKKAHDIAFFHLPKNAGGSLGEALANSVDLIPHDVLRNKWKTKCYKSSFAIVRNPLSRLVSAYNWILREKCDVASDKKMKGILQEFGSFEAVVDHLEFICQQPEAIHFLPQVSWLYDQNKCLVTSIGHFEQLNTDLQAISKRYNFKSVDLNKWKVHASKKTVSNEEAYQSSATLNKVLDFYSKDFDCFGYSQSLTEMHNSPPNLHPLHISQQL